MTLRNGFHDTLSEGGRLLSSLVICLFVLFILNIWINVICHGLSHGSSHCLIRSIKFCFKNVLRTEENIHNVSMNSN